MYLKRVEICGFKSFADRTRLEFEPGISGIIGPNGCGKSNVADAIRWCLGEQSARSLRSHQMMDVIFGGSQSRATTGMSEVSLTFDNSTNLLPIDYSEVTVTRRLFRSGESEYFINKAQCRLKDIKDMFLDTGIGTEGYAVMEQGKVEFVLSAKPEERRELFEEAAGVSKFKARREETLRKLEKVDIDMNRVNDMLALLKEQINSLDIAAKKARQYQKHRDELRRLEIAHLVQKIVAATKDIERLKAELEPKQQKYEQLNTAFDQSEAEIAQLRLTQLEKDEAYVLEQDELSKIKSGIDLADERIQQADRRHDELSERRDTLAAEIETGRQKGGELSAEAGHLALLCQQLTAEVTRLEREYKEKDLQAQNLRGQVSGHQAEETRLNEMLFSAAEERVRLNNEKNRLMSLHVRCQAQVVSLTKELGRLKEQFTPLNETALRKEQELNEFNVQKNQATALQETTNARLLELELRLQDIAGRKSALKEKIVSSESRHRTLEEWERTNPARAAIHSVVDLNIPGISGPLGGMVRISAGNEDVVAAALGEKLNYLLCDTIETAQKAITHLENNGLGRVTFIVLDRLNECHPAAAVAELPGTRTLLSLIQFDPQLENVMKFICGQTIVSGRTLFGNAVISGGSVITFDNPVLIDEQLKRLLEEIESAQAALNTITGEETTVSVELAALREEKKNNDIVWQRLSLQCELHEGQLREQKEKCLYVEKEMAIIESEIQLQQADELRIAQENKTVEESIALLDTQEKDVRLNLQTVTQRIQSAREEENLLSPLVTESKVAWATQSNELSSRRREEEKLKENARLLDERTEQARQELLITETRIAEEAKVRETESVKLRELQRERETKEKEVQYRLEERHQITRQLEETTTRVHELRSQFEAIEQDVQNLRLEQRSFELQKQSMEQRITEDFELNFADIAQEYATVAVNEEEMARLKRRIESMGPVNLAAPEEYANLEERYNFLLTQQQDLIKAKEDLHQVITKINHTTRENFKKTFDLIRENFRTIYHRLFEGGEADLILTDEANLLECGVDIVAQPPGKKLQNIALLSGGEKAFTAIALLFAFFMVRPSPFCILDEVDAPLDDANIGRFINIVKSFSEKSQFLMITHNKRTMAMADILYGVTMEELGVSKIISVRLQKENPTTATATA